MRRDVFLDTLLTRTLQSTSGFDRHLSVGGLCAAGLGGRAGIPKRAITIKIHRQKFRRSQ